MIEKEVVGVYRGDYVGVDGGSDLKDRAGLDLFILSFDNIV